MQQMGLDGCPLDGEINFVQCVPAIENKRNGQENSTLGVYVIPLFLRGDFTNKITVDAPPARVS
jgi:hypothetical protein